MNHQHDQLVHLLLRSSALLNYARLSFDHFDPVLNLLQGLIGRLRRVYGHLELLEHGLDALELHDLRVHHQDFGEQRHSDFLLVVLSELNAAFHL